MERTLSGGHHDIYDDDLQDDRRSRFMGGGSENGSVNSLRERAASQPPRSSDTAPSLVSSPPSQHFLPSSLGGVGGAWPTSSSTSASSARMLSPNRGQAIPIRSSSFSAHPQGQFSSTMRDRLPLPSTFETFEDDESEALSDTYDERFLPSMSMQGPRGRTYDQDPTRSRSQSLATGRPGPVGSPYLGTSAMQSWNESYLSSHANSKNNGQQRGYGDIKPPPVVSRYGSVGRSPATDIHSSSSPTSGGGPSFNGYSRHQQQQQQTDISNMSPFMRDVGQIMNDGSAFRELWAGMNPPRDENGGGSGTTSRRHSVSVVQPRRGNVIGFNAPATDELPPVRSTFQPSYGGRSGLLLTDDDLASDLGLLNLNPHEPPSSSSTTAHPSQPASLPIYAPLSRSPPSRDLMSAYQSINLSIPSGASSGSYTHAHSRQQTIGTPSDGGYEQGGQSPSMVGVYEQFLDSPQYGGSTRAVQRQQEQQTAAAAADLAARFIPGQGVQYLQQQQQQQPSNINTQYVRARAPSYTGSTSMQSPISPTTSARALINPQQPPFYPQTQRRLSDAHQHPHGHGQPPTPTTPQHTQQANLSELGKGVPLHAVPPNWPLFIVEFKAGRTDLFYFTDANAAHLAYNNPNQLGHGPSGGTDIRVGDLVIVEADRGKDLGKVVNDSITLAEVEAFQVERGMFGGLGGMGGEEPTSPQGKKEISPKMIYGKAGQQDMQLYATKMADELKALQLCQSKVRAKKLPMEVIDAEYQWDRRKLTFYFIAEKRIDFRELVRELFRLYKTRIWMASLQGGVAFDQ